MLGYMKTILLRGGSVALSVFLLAGVAKAQEVVEGAEAAVEECVARIQPEKVSVQAEPLQLSAVYSESIGKVLSALIEESSGIKVVEVEEVEPTGDAPNSAPIVRVSLDLSNAVAGEWTLSFQGEGGKCTAKVTVQAAESPSL